MVLSNKKLKQKLRAELAKSLAESVAKPHSNNNGSAKPDKGNQLQQPKSLKVLLDLATQRPRLSKREKRRKALTLRGPEAANRDGSEENNGGGEEGKKEGSGSEGLREKKKKRKRERYKEERDGVLGSEENGVEKSNEKKKKNKNKNKNKKKKKAKNEEEKGNMVMETNEKNDRYFFMIIHKCPD